ncbi:MAG: lipocalin family protein [Bosea sp.]|uniref:lipocalin family protein n=1 Tax=Bosea sp. (in: a-proteobacteria) TaxID=1871050 RepID=UPI001AC6CE0B|nr:lipocalin family protein [Bosea sp. (in: a-proteobacteria)]MBN9471423.1 lipocalin family protein [Bosea sp. (in: a-proteobacteria)]
MRYSSIIALTTGLLLGACNPLDNAPVGNARVPEPAKSVELERYLGKWYELARYEASFQRGCEAVTAKYSLRPDGDVRVINTCRQDSPKGPARSAEAVAKPVEGSNGAKLRVSFFQPIYGDYWVLDRANDYSWAIVGEPSGKNLWILSRTPNVSERQYQRLVQRAAGLGYDVSMLRRTKF